MKHGRSSGGAASPREKRLKSCAAGALAQCRCLLPHAPTEVCLNVLVAGAGPDPSVRKGQLRWFDRPKGQRLVVEGPSPARRGQQGRALAWREPWALASARFEGSARVPAVALVATGVDVGLEPAALDFNRTWVSQAQAQPPRSSVGSTGGSTAARPVRDLGPSLRVPPAASDAGLQ